MAEFTVNTHRLDPYKNFRFKVKWSGKYVAGLTWISPLRRSTQVITFREGGSPSVLRAPGIITYDPIVMRAGVTHDTAFEDWANLGGAYMADLSLKNFRRDITIELLNEAGVTVIAYRVFRCWVSEYVALPILDAGAAAVAIQEIRIENEGWERDTSVAEPAET